MLQAAVAMLSALTSLLNQPLPPSLPSQVITPSAHVDDFRGPIPADALADIYAGRHEKVPAAVLREASHFMRYSYAVYSLEPRIERLPSLLDVACWKPPAPEDVIEGVVLLEGW